MCRRIRGGRETREKDGSPSLELVFKLSVLGYCRNMAVQYGRINEGGPAHSGDIKGSFEDNKNTIFVVRLLHTNQTFLWILFSISAIFYK